MMDRPISAEVLSFRKLVKAISNLEKVESYLMNHKNDMIKALDSVDWLIDQILINSETFKNSVLTVMHNKSKEVK